MEGPYLEIHETVLLKTTEGRYVKLFILDIRDRIIQYDDAPSVDFAYIFTDEIDPEPPMIKQVTLLTDGGTRITKPVSETVEFEITDDPVALSFELDELAFYNRGLREPYSLGSWERQAAWWWYPVSANGFMGKTFCGIHFATPEDEAIVLDPGDDEFWQNPDSAPNMGDFVDQGFYFCDLLGNELQVLPFREIRIIRVEN